MSLKDINTKGLSSDGLFAVRGIAAFLVFFLHETSLNIPQSIFIHKVGFLKYPLAIFFRGEVGVGIFIFLSGYLLALKVPHGSAEWFNFYLRRFSRIYPVYLFMLVVAIGVSKEWNPFGIVNAVLLLPNLPATFWPFPYLSTAWSLGVEWTLYFVFPLFVVLATRNRKALFSFIVLMHLVLIGGNLVGTDMHSLVSGSILGRSLEFLFGILLARNWDNIRVRIFDPKFLVAVSAMFYAWCMWYLYAGGSVSNSYLRVLQPIAESLLGLVLIVVSQCITGGFLRRTISPLVSLGKISYPFYLVHVTAITYTNQFFQNHFNHQLHGVWLVVDILGSTVLSVLGAWLLHEAIELPGMRLGRSRTQF